MAILTGIKIRAVLNLWKERKDALEHVLKENTWTFDPILETDPKYPPHIQTKLMAAVEAVCALQEIQQLYNSKVIVPVGDRRLSLAFIVKMVGEVGAMKARWRGISLDTGRDRWSSRNLQRSVDERYAAKAVSDEKAFEISAELGNYAALLRDAMAKGNTAEIELDVDDALLNPPTALL